MSVDFHVTETAVRLVLKVYCLVTLVAVAAARACAHSAARGKDVAHGHRHDTYGRYDILFLVHVFFLSNNQWFLKNSAYSLTLTLRPFTM